MKVILIIFIIVINTIFAQNYNAFTIGGNLYLSGAAIEMLNINNTKNSLILFSIGSLKHNKEQRIESVYKDQGGKDFIFDKINYAYALRLGYGLKKNLIPPGNFKKVSLDIGSILAPTLGIITPYYIDVAVPISATQVIPKTEIYDPNKHSYWDIIGQTNFFRHIGPISYIPGIHFNSFILLQFFEDNSNWVRILRIGIQIDVFTKKLPIMATQPNKSVWLTPYIAGYIGNKKETNAHPKF